MGRRGAFFAIALAALLIVTANPASAQDGAAPSSGPPIRPTEVTYTTPPNYDALVAWWQQLEVQYPNYLYTWSPNQAYALGQVPSSSPHPPYDLYMVRLTNETLGFHKPEVFFMGNPHGDEKAGPIGAYWFVHWLLRHAFNDSWNTPHDDWLRWLLDNREVYFLVSHNPDGFDRVRRCDATNIDLNREADHDGPEPAQSGCSRTPSQVFESVAGKTVARFVNEHQFRTGMDFHGGTRALLIPWGSSRGSVSGVSPITGRTWNYASPDFGYFDVFAHRMGDFMGDYNGIYGGNFGPTNVGTPPGIVGYVAQGTYLSWGYGSDTAANPAEAPYVDFGPYRGSGALWITPEISTTKNPPAGQYGGDDTLGFGIDVRRMLLAMIDGAQPYVRWHPAGAPDGFQVQQGDYFDLAWQVNGSLVVDSTRVQWGPDPDPVNNPASVLPEHTDFAGQWSGGTGWDGAMNGATSGRVWTERILAPTTVGTYYFVARAKVDQRYAQVLRPDVYGSETYLRIVKERAMPGWSEDIPGADGVEHMEHTEWWTSPVLRIEVVGDVTPPVITLRSPPAGSVIRAGTPLDFDVFDGTLNWTTIAWDTEIARPFPPPWDVNTISVSDGPHRYYVTAEDVGGLRTEGQYDFIFDSTAPSVVLLSPPDGSAITPGTVLDFQVSDVHLTTVTWTNGGPPTNLPVPHDLDTTGWTEGLTSVQVTAFDAAGNWARRTSDFTVDANPPVVTLASPANGSVVRPGTILDFGIADITAITATYDLGAGPQAFAAPWDIDTIARPDGPLAVAVSATDAAGHVATASFAFTIDSQGPTITLGSPADGAIVKPGTTLDFQVADANLASVTLDVGAGPVPLGDPYDVPTTGWADGTRTATVRATDEAGNDAVASFTITIDGTPPSLARTDTGTFVRPGWRLAFTASDAHLDTVTWSAGGPSSPLVPPFEVDTTGWADGTYGITVRAMDLAGNEASVSAAIVLDGTPPVVALSDPPGDVVARPGLLIRFSITDANLQDAVVGVAPGYESTPLLPPYAVDTAAWLDGEYGVRATAYDRSGNEGTAIVSVTIDGTSPVFGDPLAEGARVGASLPVTVAVTEPHGPTAVTLHWRLNNGTWEAIPMTSSGGSYTATIPAFPEPGYLELYFRGEDGLGNAADTGVFTRSVEPPSEQPSVGGFPVTWAIGLVVLAVAVIAIVLVRRRRRESA